jgi:hypothetical protein
MLKKFLEKNLEAAEKYGNEVQSVNMATLIAEVSQNTGELSDFMSGVRKLDNHHHHNPKHLTEVSINGIVAIAKIRREIGR